MSKRIKRLEDLARLAGTSIATVSRALRDDPAVKLETRERIVRIAVEHGFSFVRYSPSLPADGRISIAVVVPQPLAGQPRLSDPFLMELLAGIAEAGRDRDCDIVISPATPMSHGSLLELIRRPQIYGTVVLGQSSLHEAFNDLADEGHRFAVWGAAWPGQRYCSVGSDNEAGGARATRHLLRLGRRRIAFLGSALNPEIKQRKAGYLRALNEFDVEPDPQLEIASYFNLESGEDAVAGLVRSMVKFDAIVAASDILGFAAVRCLTNGGFRIPEDVAIVGYDNISISRFAIPPLSTIAQDTALAGRMLISKVLGTFSDASQMSERLPTELVVRSSCGA